MIIIKRLICRVIQLITRSLLSRKDMYIRGLLLSSSGGSGSEFFGFGPSWNLSFRVRVRRVWSVQQVSGFIGFRFKVQITFRVWVLNLRVLGFQNLYFFGFLPYSALWKRLKIKVWNSIKSLKSKDVTNQHSNTTWRKLVHILNKKLVTFLIFYRIFGYSIRIFELVGYPRV